MSGAVKYNDITINFIPNPQYQQTLAARFDKQAQDVINVAPNQIVKLEIFKSLKTHLTDVRLELDNMDHNSIAFLGEGKYIVQIIISAFIKNKSDSIATTNYFLLENIKITSNSQLVGYYPTVGAVVNLKSIFRQRLEIENHLAFELGGKGNHSIAGTGVAPIQFLSSELSTLISSAYSPDDHSTPSSPKDFFDLSSTSTDASVLVTSGPDSGYKMEVDTNLEVLDFFFDHYPLFKTPYGWVIDDFSTERTKSITSVIRVTDFLRYDSWKTNFDPVLSKIITGSDNHPTFDPQSYDQAIAEQNKSKLDNQVVAPTSPVLDRSIFEDPLTAAGSLTPYLGGPGPNPGLALDYKIIEFNTLSHISYHNTSKFLFRDGFPLIFAQSIYDNQPINMSIWNDGAKQAYVLTSDVTKLRVKQIDNPMYRQYLTFLTAKEITDIQKYRSLFYNLHPEILTHSFDNVWVGEVDIHKSIFLDKDGDVSEANYNLDRYAIGYQVKHTYERKATSQSIQQQNIEIEGEAKAMRNFPPKFKLQSNLSLLYVDAGPVFIQDYEKLTNSSLPNDQTFNAFDLSNYANSLMCSDGQSTDLGGIPTTAPGSPGNDSVAASAKTLIDHGFRYLWGGDRANAMDCSAFTMYAVNNAGAAAGRRTKYPNGTSNQLRWLSDKRNAAMVVTSIEHIQPGDIVFFKTSRGDHGHTAIAKSSSEYYHSNSVHKKGADIGSFTRRKPSYIFRVLPLDHNYKGA